MREVFGDTSYFIALLNSDDDLNDRARREIQALARTRIVTTELVLAEVLNWMAGQGERSRESAVKFTRAALSSPSFRVVPHSTQLFRAALELYAARGDKRWGLVDCLSFIVMERDGLSEALTYDIHFEQAGFVALLRR